MLLYRAYAAAIFSRAIPTYRVLPYSMICTYPGVHDGCWATVATSQAVKKSNLHHKIYGTSLGLLVYGILGKHKSKQH